MSSYSSRTKKQLVNLAKRRVIDVPSNSAPSKAPTKEDYVQALKQDDARKACWTFRFMSLQPEMRNIIYNELLILRNSFTCHPQILRTCRTIRDEATKILYCENLIEIKIFDDGVYVHGDKRVDWYNHDDSKKTGWLIRWPDFLRRAQFVRMTVVNYRDPYTIGFPLPTPGLELRFGNLHYIVHSLCTFLRYVNRIDSLVIDMTNLQAQFSNTYGVYSAERYENIRTVLQPVRLLSNAGIVQGWGVGTASGNLRTTLTPSTALAEIARKIASGSTEVLIEQIQIAQATYAKLAANVPTNVFWTLTLPLRPDTTFSIEDIDRPGKLRNVFLFMMDFLRPLWHRSAATWVDERCKEEIGRLLKLEVEVLLLLSKEPYWEADQLKWEDLGIPQD